jgi:hypothetical protein
VRDRAAQLAAQHGGGAQQQQQAAAEQQQLAELCARADALGRALAAQSDQVHPVQGRRLQALQARLLRQV